MEWIIHLLRQHSELAIFLTIAAGFWIGKMRTLIPQHFDLTLFISS